jgi:hypothetical protein
MTITYGPKLGQIINALQGEVWYTDLRRLLRGLDQLVQATVKDKDLATPPGSPANGDAYIVAGSPTGAWAGQAGKIAAWTTDIAVPAWEFYTPKDGFIVWVDDEALVYRYDGGAWAILTARDIALPIIIGDGVNTITTGVKGYVEVPFACTIIAARLLGDASGSIVIDIWKDIYANLPPTVADTITASAKPTLSSAQKSQDTTLTGWTTAIAAGDWLGFNVDSITTLKQVTLSLTLRRT